MSTFSGNRDFRVPFFQKRQRNRVVFSGKVHFSGISKKNGKNVHMDLKFLLLTPGRKTVFFEKIASRALFGTFFQKVKIEVIF